MGVRREYIFQTREEDARAFKTVSLAHQNLQEGD
jgi:hypothetical protein